MTASPCGGKFRGVSEDALDRRIEALLAERANQPFGDHEAVAGRTLHPFSRASHDAAANLLDKALRALADGDDERAATFAARAARLPFDRHEEALPAATEAHMALFNSVTDEAEDSDDDSRWLDAALEVIDTAEPDGAASLRRALEVMVDDFQLLPAEKRRIRAATAGAPDRPDVRDRQLDPEELTTVVLSILRTVVAYEQAVDALYDDD